MNSRAIAGIVAAAAVLAAAGWYSFGATKRARPPVVARQPLPNPLKPGGDTVTVATGGAAKDTGGTPMRERVAVIGLLNKRNGVTHDLALRPGQARRVGDTIVRLRACEQTAPWEQQRLTGAFVQVDVRGADQHSRRVFSGWLFKERPQLNVVLHPVYDVWVKSCKMSFPATGPGTVPIDAASSAKKSALDASATRNAAAKESPSDASAADNNAT